VFFAPFEPLPSSLFLSGIIVSRVANKPDGESKKVDSLHQGIIVPSLYGLGEWNDRVDH